MTHHRTYFLGLIAAIVGLLLPSAAKAVPVLPGATYSITLNSDGVIQTYSGPGGYALPGVFAEATPGPSLYGEATGASSCFSLLACANSLEGTLSYSFAVDGPLIGISVPMFVTTTLRVSTAGGIGSGGASARFNLLGSAGQLLNNTVIQTAPGQPSSFSGTIPFSFVTGQVGGIGLQINATAFPGQFTTAFADPYIFIDPDFLSRNPGYSVIVSSGIGNTPPGAVPEPSALLLFGAGLAGLGTISLRRRKR